MKEIKGELFSHIGTADIVCITTNGFVKSNGLAVMGKGCAKQATEKWPKIQSKLGNRIRARGNIVTGLIKEGNTVIAAYPVKPVSEVFTGENAVKHMRDKFKVGDTVPGWACLANIEIIKKSARKLVAIADHFNFTNIVIPRMGCGAGELMWSEVRKHVENILDDRFSVITF